MTAQDAGQVLGKLLDRPSRVEMFPELRTGWTQALVLENQLVLLATRLLDKQYERVRDRLTAKEKAELGEIVAWRRRLESDAARLPTTFEAYEARQDEVTRRYREIERKNFFVEESIDEVQRQLLGWKRRGVLLAIASKNDEETALAALERHPEMLLRPGDFAARRIHWGDKAQSLVDIAAELRLGVSSLVFLDDHPVERARVRAALPEVLVPELPEDKLLVPAALCAVPVAAKGQVVGVLVVIRSKSEPFGDRESGALSDLAPVVAASLESSKFTRSIEAQSLVDPLTGRGAEVPLYRREALAVGAAIAGPALIEEDDTTTVVAAGFSAAVDRHGYLVLERRARVFA